MNSRRALQASPACSRVACPRLPMAQTCPRRPPACRPERLSPMNLLSRCLEHCGPLVAVAMALGLSGDQSAPGALGSAGGRAGQAPVLAWSARSRDHPRAWRSSGVLKSTGAVGWAALGARPRSSPSPPLCHCCPWCGGFVTRLTLVPQGLKGRRRCPGAQPPPAPLRVEVPLALRC